MPCDTLYDITSIHASYIIKIFIIFKMLYNNGVIPWLDHGIHKKLKKTGSGDQVAG